MERILIPCPHLPSAEPKWGSHRNVGDSYFPGRKDLAPQILVGLLRNRFQMSSLSGMASAAESHLAQGHALVKVTHIQ